MEKLELANVNMKFENLIDPFISLLLPEQAAGAAMAHAVLKLSGSIRDYSLCQKFARFINALHETDLEASVGFSNQLFGDEKSAKENGLRLVQYIDEAETLTVVDYMVNASRAAGNKLVEKDMYFRILWALTNTFPEDLHYFRKIALTYNPIPGNTQIIALARSGLMLMAGTDSNRAVEEQDYIVTEFGTIVDRYALSFDDEERMAEWKRREKDNNKMSFKTNAAEVLEDKNLLVFH